MTLETRKGILGLITGSLLLALVLYLIKREAKKDEETKSVSSEGIEIAYEAYKAAIEAGEDQATLDDLNLSLKKQFGVYVIYRDADDRYVVRNLLGNNLRIY